MRAIWRLALYAGALAVFGQLVRPAIPANLPVAEMQTPPAVRQILYERCYSCHSNEPRLAWFDQVEPVYLIARHDILSARSRLNFSTLGTLPQPVQRAKLFEAVNMIQLGAMPLPRFLALHPQEKVSAEELAELKAYLAPWANTSHVAVNAPEGESTRELAPTSPVRPEPNGLAFDPSFKSWTLISTTDRGDNNTFRFILGNDIAAAAARAGHTSPWPDGTRLAKVAWQQELGRDGLVHPGKFIQVELMVKDARRYKETAGWAWGRWRGRELVPYGEGAKFVGECTGCHLPMRGNDSVYTLPISEARVNGEERVDHAAAALPTALPWRPLGWRPITMYVDQKRHTIATLFGNDTALQSLQIQRATKLAYGPGSALALVTWVEREDPHWFGGRIPDRPQRVEFVEVDAGTNTKRYRLFAGSGLVESQTPAPYEADREDFILNLKPAPLP